MRKYEGTLIHQLHDDDGVLEVVEGGGVRSLHFGSHSRQSSMLISDPYHLQLSYVRAMMGWLIFRESPGRVLNVGLGGGSLVKFLLNSFFDCLVDAIEFRKSVARIARSHFGLPKDERLRIFIGDGACYIRQCAQRKQQTYDLIFLDAFDHEGMSDSIKGQPLFDACRQILNPTGMLVINLWGGNKLFFNKTAQYVEDGFNRRTLYLPVRDRGNTIGFAFREGVGKVSIKETRARAELLERKYGIEFPMILKDLKRKNRKAINRFIS